ncbi:hypothetical protein FHS29_006306 [Saccharothrix tamanrassetensis]|uniref:Uncharacterized protein n=1 Tax=Saccharothrix tamanrassetensis TaxID=1051531 RepID=A0A841CUR0_9PSEU|nr:hypothetical protein [Saccharothrix tamanrassetensis]MBB5959685.1 hypothetical protein [Saccharothrix tamanrassetensis]
MGERDGQGRDRVAVDAAAARDARFGQALRAALLDAPDGVPDPERVEAAVRAAGATPVARSRRGVWLAAGVVTVLLVGVAAGWQFTRRGSGPESTTVPVLQFTPGEERNPQVLLSGLAELAEKQPGPAGSGPWLYRVGRQWNFSTSVDTEGKLLGQGLGEDWSQSWTGGDGAVRWTRVSVDPSRGAWEPLAVDDPAKRQEDALPPVGTVSAEQVREWLLKQVRSGTSTSPGDERSTAQWFQAVSGDRAADDPVFAAVALRMLASLPGITVEGETRDRAGRRAVAVSAVSELPGERFPKQRLYLLIDPQTGMMLAGETVGLTAGEGALGASVPLPATLAYDLWFPGVFVADKHTHAFLGAGQAAGAAPASAVPAVRGRAWCFKSADLRDKAEPVGTGDPTTPRDIGEKERGPVEVCSLTWQSDRYGWTTGTVGRRNQGDHPVPPLAACVLTERVPGVEPTTVAAVFPGGEGTCRTLGLPDAQ